MAADCRGLAARVMTSIADQDRIDRTSPVPLAAAWSDVRVARWLPLLAVFAAAISLRLVLVANTGQGWADHALRKSAWTASGSTSISSKSIHLRPSSCICTLVARRALVALRPEVIIDAGVFFAIGVVLELASHILRKIYRLQRHPIQCGSPCW